jgi:hypothetical protein
MLRDKRDETIFTRTDVGGAIHRLELAMLVAGARKRILGIATDEMNARNT